MYGSKCLDPVKCGNALKNTGRQTTNYMTEKTFLQSFSSAFEDITACQFSFKVSAGSLYSPDNINYKAMHSSTCLLLTLFACIVFLAIQPANSNCLMQWKNDDRQRTKTVLNNHQNWQPNPQSWQPNRPNGQRNRPNEQPNHPNRQPNRPNGQLNRLNGQLNRPNWQPDRQKTSTTFVPPSAPPQFEIQLGRPRMFCNLFGCNCTPPPGSRCCTGYRYDSKSQSCRELKGVKSYTMNYCMTKNFTITLYCILLTIAYAYPQPLPTNPNSQSAASNSTVHRRQAPIAGRLQLPNGPPQRTQTQRLSPSVRRRPSEYQAYEDLLQVKPKIKSSDLRFGNKKPQGAPQKFCSKFGCDCVPAANAKCCSGYRFDKRSNTCRRLSG
ncbi:hypothetical protein JTE90_012534 [Oedothorax gibbosus]|uniref:Uncharacterized protein n=1 Tax=Oedothorax gibbosus TaxID=931172 RepID=A0AAV6U5A4_9ARAC|nr:hypothetical protein JTE90_012534 [Oedothorax gibbosus]